MASRRAPEVDGDLDGIWYYLVKESGSIEIADRQIDRITEAFYLLSTHPHLGRRRDEDLRSGLRSFTVGNYIILYRIDGEDALILYVMDGRRDIPALIGDRQK